MIQFEDAIQEALKANGIPEVEAGNFRLPYFDVTADNATNALPAALTRARVTITLGGRDVEVNNPLLNYTLERDVRAGDLGVFRRGSVTGRGGTVAETNARWRANWRSIRTGVQRSMNATTFAQFLHSPTNSNALEYPHGDIHVVIGGDGPGLQNAMTHPELAALDPIFWFHHCNIDRLWHEWQKRRNHPAWNVPAGTREGPTDPLTPWTSTFREVNHLHDHPQQVTYSAGSFSTPQISPSARVGHLNIAASFGFADTKYISINNVDMSKMRGPFYVRLYGVERGENVPVLLDQRYIFRRASPEQCENCREHRTICLPFNVTGNPHTMSVKFVNATDNTEHDASEFGQWEIQVENTIVPR